MSIRKYGWFVVLLDRFLSFITSILLADTGFFNIQVIQRALAPFRLELVSYSSQEPIAQQARNNPLDIQAYICNLGAHWITVRRFARQYFNLNSVYYVPELVSDQNLLINLDLLEDSGYSVFIVHGRLDPCIADDQLAFNPIHPSEYLSLTKDLPKLIMDGKVMDGLDGVSRNGKGSVALSQDLIDEYEKNPYDPEVRKKIEAKLPKGLKLANPPKNANNLKSRQRRGLPSLFVVSESESEMDAMMAADCGCPHCRQRRGQHPMQSHMSEGEFLGDIDPNRPTRSVQGATMVTRQFTQVLIDRPNPNIPKGSAQPRNNAMSLLIIRERRTMSSSIGDQMLSATDQSDLQMDQADDPHLREAIARSLLEQGPIDEIKDPVVRDQLKKQYQEHFDEIYAKNLYMRETEAEILKLKEEAIQLEQMIKMKNSSTPATYSQPVRNPIPSLLPASRPLADEQPSTVTNTSSPVPIEPFSTSTNKPVISLPTPNTPLSSPMEKPPINAPLPPVTTAVSAQPTVTNFTPPTTPISEPKMTATVSSPKLTPQSSVESPTIEGKLFLTFQ